MGLIDIKLKPICKSCANYGEDACRNHTCSRCVVERVADPYCIGVESCRELKINEFKTECKEFSLMEWEK